MRNIYALLAVCALASALIAAACGGGDEEGDGGAAAQPAATQPAAAPATSAPASGAAPTPPPTPTPRTETGARPTPTPVASFAAVTPWFQSGAYNIGTAAGKALLRGELLRELVTRYFDAVNAYDLNALLPLLEEGYRTDNETEIRDLLSGLEDAGGQLSWTEDQAPGLTGPTTMVMLLTVEGPSGSESWHIQFTELGRNSGNWVISGAGPAP